MREVRIVVHDDLDGSPAMDEAVIFGWAGTVYEIDLNEEHYKELGELLRPWIEKAREREDESVSRSTRKASHRPNLPGGATTNWQEYKSRTRELAKVRTWARDVKGIDIPAGRIPMQLHEQYNRDHPDDQVAINYKTRRKEA